MLKEKKLNALGLEKDLKKLANPAKAGVLARFFKTGPGEYGAGDNFLGIVVPAQRKLARFYYADLTLKDLNKLIASPWHEVRLTALLILVEKFNRANEAEKKTIFSFYLKNTKHINNWDLVDLSADKIAGAHLVDRGKAILFKLARSKNIWERRIALLASFNFIKQGQPEITLLLVEKLLSDKHDLIQKAAGWMLREVGKRVDEKILEAFLDKHYKVMPRVMLRYAIERMPEEKRKKYRKK